MAQCSFCFRTKSPLQPPIKGISVEVCKACAYEIDRVVGFLTYHGMVVRPEGTQPDFYTPPNPPKSKSRRVKKEA